MAAHSKTTFLITLRRFAKFIIETSPMAQLPHPVQLTSWSECPFAEKIVPFIRFNPHSTWAWLRARSVC
jgi:hypothetical protein